MKNKYLNILNILTTLLIVLNFQIRLELSHSIDYHRDIYSMNLIYYDNRNNLFNEK